jgi:hypothetical protein
MYGLEHASIMRAMQNNMHKRLTSLVYVEPMMRERANFEIDQYIRHDCSRKIADALFNGGFVKPQRNKDREIADRSRGAYPVEIHEANLYCFTPDELFSLLETFGYTVVQDCARHQRNMEYGFTNVLTSEYDKDQADLNRFRQMKKARHRRMKNEKGRA